MLRIIYTITSMMSIDFSKALPVYRHRLLDSLFLSRSILMDRLHDPTWLKTYKVWSELIEDLSNYRVYRQNVKNITSLVVVKMSRGFSNIICSTQYHQKTLCMVTSSKINIGRLWSPSSQAMWIKDWYDSVFEITAWAQEHFRNHRVWTPFTVMATNTG